MSEFRARLEGEKLILESISGQPLFIREIIVKYALTALSPENEHFRRIVSDSIKIGSKLSRLEIPVGGLDVVGVDVIYTRGDFTLRDEIQI